MSTLIIYICGSLFIRGVYFDNYAFISVWFCLGIFYMISEHFEKMYAILSNNKNINKHLIAICCWLLLMILGLLGFYRDPLQANYIQIIVFLLFCSINLYVYGSLKELIYYPITRIFFWLIIIWLIRNWWSTMFNNYEKVSIEKARIRDSLESTPNDRHPPLIGPWIVSDPEQL